MRIFILFKNSLKSIVKLKPFIILNLFKSKLKNIGKNKLISTNFNV